MATDYDAPRSVDAELDELVLHQAASSVARMSSLGDIDDSEEENVSASVDSNLWDESASGVKQLVLPQQYDEFVCEGCSLIQHQSRKSRANQILCSDCC